MSTRFRRCGVALLTLVIFVSGMGTGGRNMAETIVNVDYAGILQSLGYSESVVFGEYETAGMKSIMQAAGEAGTWLANRYPDHAFEMISAENGSTLRKTSCFTVKEGDISFSVYRYGREDRDPLFEETYWGIAHRQELNRWAAEKFALLGLDFALPDLEINDRIGDDCKPEDTLQDLMDSFMLYLFLFFNGFFWY